MKALKKALLGLALLVSAGQGGSAFAAPITLDLTYTPSDSAGLTGTGYVTFDDSLLLTGSGGFVAPAAVADFALTVFGASIPGGSTSFGLVDLVEWVLSVDGSGTVAGITDLNFFMDGAVNSAGVGINGDEVFYLKVYSDTGTLGHMDLTTITDHNRVPEPVPSLLLGGGLIVLGWLRRRARTL